MEEYLASPGYEQCDVVTNVLSSGISVIQGDPESSNLARPPPVKPSHWPWSGRVRRYIYIDFLVYAVLLVVFCISTLNSSSTRSFDSYHLVQSVQKMLLKEVRTPSLMSHPQVPRGRVLLQA
jgi:hypothetical protein